METPRKSNVKATCNQCRQTSSSAARGHCNQCQINTKKGHCNSCYHFKILMNGSHCFDCQIDDDIE